MPNESNVTRGWKASAQAWIDTQGEKGDWSRAEILDPALEKLLGDVNGLRVVDVGCGEGRYSRVLAAKGAIVTGIDPVEAFIEQAKAKHPAGTYSQGFAEYLPYLSGSFDLVLSYLTIIDILDYKTAAAEMARVMRPDGRIVIVTVSNIASPSDGWLKDASGVRICRPVDRYMEEFTMELHWKGISIENYHRPLSAILDAFFKHGLVLNGFIEPLPPKESKEYKDEFRAPNFQILTFKSDASLKR